MWQRDALNRKQLSAALEQAGARGQLHCQLVEEGLAHHQRGRRDLAQSCYLKALAMEPDDADALHYLGVLHHQEGRSSAAADLIAKAVAIKRNDAIAYNNLGVVLESLGRCEEAVSACDQAVAIQPDYAEALNNRGNALLNLARLSEALKTYDRALAVRPGYAEAHNNRGIALHKLRRFAEAMASFDRALQARANYAEAFNNRGSALLALNDAAHALESFDRALAVSPLYAEALFNRGNALLELNRYQGAIASYDSALAVRPDYGKALNNRGNALKDQGRLDEAVTSYRKALAAKPDYAEVHSNLLFAQQYMDRYSNADLLNSALQFGESIEPGESSNVFLNDRSPNRRLRIGYLSGDFRSHPVGFFSARALEAHNRAVVEVYCYTDNSKIDHLTERFQRAAHHWRSVVGLSDADAASLIVRDRIDILVDLSGHTAHNRLPMFALRPAPVQASWLGYPGTTGLRAIDYLIMDEYAVRPGEEIYYTEVTARLPFGRFCYSPPDYAPPPVDPPLLRRSSVTFGSFNNIGKIGPKVIQLWAAVLQATPNARLLLKWRSLDDDGTRRRLSDAFAAAGVSPHQLEFRRSSHHADLMAQYGEVDIALDPFPFSGCLTTCEAFWMGVPVVTLPGDRAASRHVLGAFYDLGLNDCVASSASDYLKRATALAHDPARLISLRHSLRARMAASPLCDGKRFAAALEWGFGEMWRRWCSGQKPAPFDIPPAPGAAAVKVEWPSGWPTHLVNCFGGT